MENQQQGPRERHLILLNDHDIRVVELTTNVVSLGRQNCNDIVINCDLISRIHASFYRVPLFNSPFHQYRLIDGGAKQKRSKHGISVNRKRCYMHNLEHGDIITFGEKIKGIYLKIIISDQKFEQYLSIILKTKDITDKTRDSIDVLTRAFYDRSSVMFSKKKTERLLPS